jgi:hypothetical protein
MEQGEGLGRASYATRKSFFIKNDQLESLESKRVGRVQAKNHGGGVGVISLNSANSKGPLGTKKNLKRQVVGKWSARQVVRCAASLRGQARAGARRWPELIWFDVLGENRTTPLSGLFRDRLAKNLLALLFLGAPKSLSGEAGRAWFRRQRPQGPASC